MQTWVLHDCVSRPLLAHAAPLYCGAGFVHDRVRSCVPPPQVTVQVPQDVQVVHAPSTFFQKEAKYNGYLTKKYTKMHNKIVNSLFSVKPVLQVTQADSNYRSKYGQQHGTLTHMLICIL